MYDARNFLKDEDVLFTLSTLPPYGAAICGVYAIRRRGSSQCYVGQSVDVRARVRDHRKCLRYGDHHAEKLQAAFERFGEDAFDVEILAAGLNPRDREMMALVEQEFMDALPATLNTCPIAGSPSGKKMSERNCAKMRERQAAYWAKPGSREKASEAQRKRFEDPEQRRLMSEQRKGKKLWPNGRPPISEETRAKLSAAKKGRPSPNLGRVTSDETRAKQSAAKLGKTSPKKGRPGKRHSLETRAKMSATRKGKSSCPNGRAYTEEGLAKLRAGAAKTRALMAAKKERASDKGAE